MFLLLRFTMVPDKDGMYFTFNNWDKVQSTEHSSEIVRNIRSSILPAVIFGEYFTDHLLQPIQQY